MERKYAYVALCYVCNENCLYCPCGSLKSNSSTIMLPINDLIETVEHFRRDGITDIVLSGGEPTLHPMLPQLIAYIHSKDITVTLLTNGERFGDTSTFLEHFLRDVDKSKLCVITTLHSHKADEHESANQTPGSFLKTMTGLRRLQNAKVPLILKHCITKRNYCELRDFFQFYVENFAKDVALQLCAIDYEGIPEERLDTEMLTFPQLRPYLEDMFDDYLNYIAKYKKRKLYGINIPLCSCDAYYWRLLRGSGNIYQAYQDPVAGYKVKSERNVGVNSDVCAACVVKDICPGTYKSAFDLYGHKFIKPYGRTAGEY